MALDNNDIKIMMKSVVCEDSTLIGNITISPGCVIHPSATIIAEAGPIILGENCIVEEFATIAYRQTAKRHHLQNNTDDTPHILSIGANNVFEVGCTIEAGCIGDRNIFECKCYVGPLVTVSNNCVIGAGVRLNCMRNLPENTVVYGKGCQQREAIDKHTSQTLQIDFLRKVLPNYHHLRKPNYDPKKNRNILLY